MTQTQKEPQDIVAEKFRYDVKNEQMIIEPILYNEIYFKKQCFFEKVYNFFRNKIVKFKHTKKY